MQDRSGTQNGKGKNRDIWMSGWESLSRRLIAARDQTWGKDLRTVSSIARLGYTVQLVSLKTYGATQMISSCWFFPSSQTAFEQLFFLSTASASEELKDE